MQRLPSAAALALLAFTALPSAAQVGFERWVRLSLIAHALVTPLITIVYFYPSFTTRLLFLGFPWAITAPLFMLMLALMLRTRRTPDTVPTA
jgi:hypothetical protein